MSEPNDISNSSDDLSVDELRAALEEAEVAVADASDSPTADPQEEAGA